MDYIWLMLEFGLGHVGQIRLKLKFSLTNCWNDTTMFSLKEYRALIMLSAHLGALQNLRMITIEWEASRINKFVSGFLLMKL